MKVNLIGKENEGHLYCPKCERLLYPEDDYEIKNNVQCLKCAAGMDPEESAPLQQINFML